MFGEYINGLKNLVNSVNTTYKKYEGLTPEAAIQKAVSKAPIRQTFLQYYGIASHLADSENQNPQVLKDNDFYKFSDIKDDNIANMYADKIIRAKKLNMDKQNIHELIKDTDIVIPKNNSDLKNKIHNSQELQKFIAENYNKIKNGDLKENYNSIAFPFEGEYNNKELFATIHNAELSGIKLNKDGSLSYHLNDYYDFDEIKHRNFDTEENINLNNKIKALSKNWIYNKIIDANNIAVSQQQAEKIKPYLLTMPDIFTKEEIEEILKKFKIK